MLHNIGLPITSNTSTYTTLFTRIWEINFICRTYVDSVIFILDETVTVLFMHCTVAAFGPLSH